MPGLQTEVKEALDGLQKTVEDFKAENDSRLKKLEEKGYAPADVEAKVDAANKRIDDALDQMEALSKKANRAADPKQESDAVKHLAKQAFRYRMAGKAVPEAVEKALQAEWKEHLAAQGVDESHPEYKALSVGTDPEGGYLVRPTVSAEIAKRVYESSPMRQLATVQQISGDAFEEPADWDEPSAAWQGEQSSRSETATNSPLKLLRVPVHSLEAEPKASQRLLDDAMVDIESWHNQKVAEKFARAEATAFISGDGVLRPRGITSYATTTTDEYGKIEQVNSGSAGAVTGDGLHDLQNALYEPFQGNASWLMQRQTFGSIRKLVDGDTRYLFSIDGGLVNGVMQLSLLGKPVRFATDMPAVAADALSIAYGDFRAGYLIVEKLGIRVLRDPYTSKGFVKFYTVKRVGGAVRQYQAIKLQKLAA